MQNEELLKQYYLSAEDLTKLLPIGYLKAMKMIDEIQKEMKEKNYFIPDGKRKVVLTKLVRKKCGL